MENQSKFDSYGFYHHFSGGFFEAHPILFETYKERIVLIKVIVSFNLNSLKSTSSLRKYKIILISSNSNRPKSELSSTRVLSGTEKAKKVKKENAKKDRKRKQTSDGRINIYFTLSFSFKPNYFEGILLSNP
jgi:hypothetical protein